jgi:hypothetical protein
MDTHERTHACLRRCVHACTHRHQRVRARIHTRGVGRRELWGKWGGGGAGKSAFTSLRQHFPNNLLCLISTRISGINRWCAIKLAHGYLYLRMDVDSSHSALEPLWHGRLASLASRRRNSQCDDIDQDHIVILAV